MEQIVTLAIRYTYPDDCTSFNINEILDWKTYYEGFPGDD
jgi:hypothetical protein